MGVDGEGLAGMGGGASGSENEGAGECGRSQG